MNPFNRRDFYAEWADRGFFTDWTLGPLMLRRSLHDGTRRLLLFWKDKHLWHGPERRSGK